MIILHILHRSLPGTHGYAIRSKYIVECQKELCLDLVVITSPFQNGFQTANGNPEVLGGIPYYRTNLFENMGSAQVRSSFLWMSTLRFPLILFFAKQVLNLAKKIRPSVIHAHSPFYCGLIASWASKRLGIPSIYEIRGVWDSSFSSVNNNKMTLPQKAIRLLENRAIQRTDAIVVISEHLKSELLSRGISNHMYVVPNGVDTTKFTSIEKGKRILEKYDLADKVIFRYIGTLSSDYEGLEYLIKALPLIIKSTLTLFSCWSVTAY